MFCFIKKSHKSKEGLHFHAFIENIVNIKLKYHLNLKNVYISKTEKKNIYETNKQGPKMICISKLRTNFFSA